MRKIIQITAISGTDDLHHPSIWALCDDGSVWGMVINEDEGKPDWLEMPSIPQEPKLILFCKTCNRELDFVENSYVVGGWADVCPKCKTEVQYQESYWI